MIPLIATSKALAGHPLWHFAVVAGAGVLAFLGIKASEWRRERAEVLARIDRRVALLSGLGLVCCAIHAYVCPEHFREWIVYGVFFMCASALQAAWSILVFLHPTRRLLLIGALGNGGVIVTYFVSRFVGIPFGPDAFQPETYDALSMVATACEAGVVALALYLASPRHPAVNPLTAAIGPG